MIIVDSIWRFYMNKIVVKVAKKIIINIAIKVVIKAIIA